MKEFIKYFFSVTISPALIAILAVFLKAYIDKHGLAVAGRKFWVVFLDLFFYSYIIVVIYFLTESVKTMSQAKDGALTVKDVLAISSIGIYMILIIATSCIFCVCKFYLYYPESRLMLIR